MRSDIDRASSWSWVTKTKVTPTSCWRARSSTCICSRRRLSSAPRGSSSSSTLGCLTKRPGERHPLPLSAGELIGAPFAETFQLDQGERALDHRIELGLGELLPAQTVGQVLPNVQVGKDRVILEHHVHRPAVRRHRRHRLTVDEHLSLRGRLESRRESAARWSCRTPRVRGARRTHPRSLRYRPTGAPSPVRKCLVTLRTSMKSRFFITRPIRFPARCEDFAFECTPPGRSLSWKPRGCRNPAPARSAASGRAGAGRR